MDQITPQTEMQAQVPVAGAEPQKSKRDALSERLKNKYPDKSFDDDDAFYGQISDDYDEYDKSISERDATIKGYEDNMSQLNSLMSKDKRAARFLTDMADGKDPFVELVRRIGLDGIKDLTENPDKIEKYAEANKDYIERQTKNDELEAEAEKNMAATSELLTQLSNEGNYSEEQIEQALLFLRQVFNDALVGKYTRESLEMALKAVCHEDDVTAAKAEGELAGRNSAIEAKLRKPKAQGDGTPQLAGSNNPASAQRNRSIFDVASEA